MCPEIRDLSEFEYRSTTSAEVFSSLNYVKDLPVDDLKIDESFIHGLGEGPVNDSIVRLIVNFAHTLGLTVTAEGVEHDRQVDSLMVMRCDLAQGFYFSKPLPSEAAGKFVATNPAWGVSLLEITIAAGADLLPRGGNAPVRRQQLSSPGRNRVLEKRPVAATNPL